MLVPTVSGQARTQLNRLARLALRVRLAAGLLGAGATIVACLGLRTFRTVFVFDIIGGAFLGFELRAACGSCLIGPDAGPLRSLCHGVIRSFLNG
jgi:hypothetical protein